MGAVCHIPRGSAPVRPERPTCGACIPLNAHDAEAHHHDYQRVRKIINKYHVADEVALAAGVRARPRRGAVPGHFDGDLDKGATPALLGDEAFYSVMRRCALARPPPA